MVNVGLRFDLALLDTASSSPPGLSGVTGKLEALTYYNSNAMNSFTDMLKQLDEHMRMGPMLLRDS